MDLPTYTSIWRIEKRLYKLYDFRLPMPLPIGQLAVFAAISVPYVVLLTVLGLPFSHTLIWLYVLPPGVATWLVTRPVIESKRLPELIRSQVRYLTEPRVWCRMAALGESDMIVVTGRVWRLASAGRDRMAAAADREARRRERIEQFNQPPSQPQQAEEPSQAVQPPQPERQAVQVREPAAPERRRAPTAPPTRPVPPSRPVGPSRPRRPTAPPRPATGTRPTVTVVNRGSAQGGPPSIEHALAAPSQRRADAWPGRVSVVPGGHRPGQPSQLQRDRARAQLPLSAHRRVVVLGCTVGAGQTVITLLIGEVLAALRPDHVAVLDLNPGSDAPATQARLRSALGQATSLSPGRLAVIAHDAAEPGADADAAATAFESAGAEHQIVLADPSTPAVTRLLAIADQLVLVAPASAAAARAIGLTYEWLDAHGHADLAADAVMVMNGVSRRSMLHVEQAERVCIGRCRAIVRIPWDDQLTTQVADSEPGQPSGGLLSPGTVSACTALAGVLVAALAGREAVSP